MPPPSPGGGARQCCAAGWHTGTERGPGTSLPFPPPCSPPAPLAAPRQPCCWGWPGDQGLRGAAGWLAWFKAQCVGRIPNCLQLIRFTQHLDIFSQKGVGKLFYSLTCYLSGLCCCVYKTYKGSLQASERWCWRVYPSSENSIGFFMNADFYVVFTVRVIIVASGRAPSSLAIPGHWEPPGWKTAMAKAGRHMVEIRGQQPNPLCRTGSGDGSDERWHRCPSWRLLFWSGFSSFGYSAVWGGGGGHRNI